MNLSKQNLLAALTGLVAIAPGIAKADGARDWLNVPVDMNFLYIYHTYTSAETSINSPLPIEGADVSANVPILRYARSFEFLGRTAGFQLVAPYAFIDAKLTGTNASRSRHGFGDVTAILLSNIYGAPALSREAFLSWKPESYLTGAVSVTMPTGSYDADRLINPGKNRWAIKPQLAWGTPINSRTWLTANGAVEFYQDNNKYYRKQKLEQAPILTLDAHYSVNVNRALWVSGDAIYTAGGETRIDGQKKYNTQSTLRLGLSAGMNISPVDAFSVGFTRTVAKKSYTPNTTTFQISYSRAW